MKVPKGFKPYRKKPVVVWAKQMSKPFTVKTLRGTVQGKTGDFLMIGVEGERYPCDKEIFEKTYEPATSSQQPGVKKKKALLKGGIIALGERHDTK